MTEAIRLERLSKSYGSVRALRDVDLVVDRGEVFGYLGPNGAGKTTTIRMLLGALKPTSGRAVVLGGAPKDPAVHRRIGYLPADFPVDPHWTGRDLLDFYARLRGGVDRGWVDTLLQRFELDPTRPFRQLSTGNKRKIGIVQAAMHRPDLLILDEPSSGLDPLLQHQFQLLVRELADGGATVLLSSHVLPEVEQLARRVAIIRRGRLVATSDIETLRSQARQRIALQLGGGADGAAVVREFEGLPGVAEASETGGTLHLVVEGSADAVIKAAARHEVVRITTSDDDLEDVFLSFYADDPAGTEGEAA